jgi:membrane glycosyltransferase
MSQRHDERSGSHEEEFAREGAAGRTGLVAEFVDFLKHNKKWWLLPILVAMVAIGVLIVLGTTGAAPFIYPLF